jgi:hypothetical protein
MTRRQKEREPRAVTGTGHFWAAGRPRKKPRPPVEGLEPSAPGPLRRATNHAAAARVRAFLEHGTPPIVTDPEEARGLAVLRASKWEEKEKKKKLVAIDIRVDATREARDVARELVVDRPEVAGWRGRRT